MHNYTGPSPLNTAFHDAPHVNWISGAFSSFSVSPATVNGDTTGYIQSLTFMPAILLLFGLLLAVGAFIAQCCRCDCSRRTRKRCCCPPLLAMETRRPCSDPCYFTALIVVSACALGAILAALVVQLNTADSAESLTDIAVKINDYQNDLTDSLRTADQQLKAEVTASSALRVLVADASPALPLDVNLAALGVYEFARAGEELTKSALNNAKYEVSIDEVVRRTRDVVQWARVATGVLFAALCLLLGAALTATFACATGPFRPCQDAAEALQSILFLLLAVTAIPAMLGVSIAAGDVCQNPMGYLNLVVSSSKYTQYYINCPPGAVSPIGPDLAEAGALVADANALTVLVANAAQQNITAYAAVYTSAVQLSGQFNSTQRLIEASREASKCGEQHARIVQLETQGCGETFNLFVAAFFLLCACTTLPMLFNCILPRRKAHVYRKL